MLTNVETAHEITRGEGITIAIIDDGVDIDHGEFTGKVVAPRDATLQTNDPRPKTCSALARKTATTTARRAPEWRAQTARWRIRGGAARRAHAD
jgi:subtilisin family serine protease